MQSAKKTFANTLKIRKDNIQLFPQDKGYIIDMYVEDIAEKIDKISNSEIFSYIIYDLLEVNTHKNVFRRIERLENYENIYDFKPIIQNQIAPIVAKKFYDYGYNVEILNDRTKSHIKISWNNCI
jgi:hypothetical protein